MVTEIIINEKKEVFHNIETISSFLFENNFLIEDVQTKTNKIIISAQTIDFKLIEVTEDFYENICNGFTPDIEESFILKRVFVEEFGKDITFKKLLHDGLKGDVPGGTGKRYGIAYFSNDEVASYVDFYLSDSNTVEICVVFTTSSFRGGGLSASLINIVRLMNPHKDIKCGTYENNETMRRVLSEKLCFRESKQIPNDRIDGSSTIYYLCNKLIL